MLAFALFEARLVLEEAVLETLLFLSLFLVLLFAVPLLFFEVFWLVLLLFRSDVFAKCDFCTAEGRACSDAHASGVNVSEVKTKAQSVIEILFIRATEQSPESVKQLIMLAYDLQNSSILSIKRQKVNKLFASQCCFVSKRKKKQQLSHF